MDPTIIPSPFVNLSAVIRALRGAVAAWGIRGAMGLPLLLLLHARLAYVSRDMERLAARFQAGVLRRRVAGVVVCPVDRPIDPPFERPEADAVRLVRGKRVWPGRFGWLIWIMGWRAAGYGSQLRAVLVEPEMVALLRASPQALRILRPLCRMLLVETSLLRPLAPGEVAPVAPEKPARVPVKRVRKKKVPIDWGRIPLPRGTLAAAKRYNFGKLPRA